MVFIKFFPIDIDYEDIEELAIRIFGKTIDNKRICVFDYDFKPYFWVIPKEDSDFDILIRRICVKWNIKIIIEKQNLNGINGLKSKDYPNALYVIMINVFMQLNFIMLTHLLKLKR